MKSLLTAIFIFVTVWANAQTSKHATARIFESQNKNLSHIVLVYETGESEIIPLENWKKFGSIYTANEILIENQKTINRVLNEMAEKGYEIAKMTSTVELFLCTFIVFTRNE